NELLVRRLSQDALSPAIVDRIVAETDGVPLFVEELTRSALEHPSLFDPSAARVDALRSTLPAPESLLATLTARIDRLGPAREIAQVAAVLGREFSFELLQAVSEWPAPRLRTALGELLESGLVLPGDARTDTTYVFKHALVRDAAYDSLLRTQRVRWHGAAARALVELHRDRVEQHLDALAHHAFEAGEWGDAIRYLTRGSAKAFSTAAFEEAAAMLERAVDASRRLPDEPSTWRCRLALLLRLHDSLLPLARYERMREVLEDAERHAERLGDSASLARIHGSHSHRLWITGSDVDVAAEAANRSLREGRAAGDDARPWLATSFILGQIEHSRGDLLAAARALRRTIDGARRRAVGERFSLYFGVVARSWLAMTLADMGDGVAACACAREAVDLAESAHDPVATIAARFGWGRARLGCGDGPEALAIAREALALPQMRWLVQWRVPLETLEGEALIACGDPRRAIDALSRTASLHDRSGLLAHHSLTLALLADAMGRAGRYEDAERAATIAMETSARRKEENFRCLAQLVRCAARARRGGGDMGDIARVLTDGLLRCRRSQARPLELRYATELSSLHERDRRRDDAASRAAAAAALASGIDRPERSP
ncbi:MAG TPA: hypothetical protein VEA81_17000, partial [Burkholderiaceae bacterium]|nr:hypothetical protein [Burkholderiaceae bacterium]